MAEEQIELTLDKDIALDDGGVLIKESLGGAAAGSSVPRPCPVPRPCAVPRSWAPSRAAPDGSCAAVGIVPPAPVLRGLSPQSAAMASSRL